MYEWERIFCREFNADENTMEKNDQVYPIDNPGMGTIVNKSYTWKPQESQSTIFSKGNGDRTWLWCRRQGRGLAMYCVKLNC